MNGWTIVRLVIALLIFGGLLHALRDVTRPIVTRFIPLSRRMQAGFLKRQSRLTIGTNLTVAIIASLVSYVLLGKLYQTDTAAVEIEETINHQDKPSPKQFSVWRTPQRKDTIKQETANRQLDVEEPLPPQRSEPTAYATDHQQARKQGRWYLQVGAFQTSEGAQKRCYEQRQHEPFIVYWATEQVPYKVLIGPFESRTAAKQYQKSVDEKSFPRIEPPEKTAWLRRNC